MKETILLLIVFTLFSCNLKEKTNDYSEIIDKHISNPKVAGFLEKLGSDYTFDDSYGPKFYKYEKVGIELNFNKSDTLMAVFFNHDNFNKDIELPYGIRMTHTRKDLENILGKPEKSYVGLNNLTSYFISKDLVIKYNSKDQINMNNGIESISVQKLNRNKVLGIK